MPTVRVGARLGNQRSRVPMKAIDGAEKSCLIKRRIRGLRKGKKRSRGRQPRRTFTDRQPDSKAQSSRVINHIGRKFIWAVKASNGLRADCEVLNKFPRGQLPDSHPAYQPRLRTKKYCLAKWVRLNKQSTVAGIHPTAAFHRSFWDFLMIETRRGDAIDGLDILVGGLRLLAEERHREESVANGSVYVTPPSTRRGGRGASRGTMNKNRACRLCGYFGPSYEGHRCKPLAAPQQNKKVGRPLRRR